jgi:hypothetical protein
VSMTPKSVHFFGKGFCVVSASRIAGKAAENCSPDGPRVRCVGTTIISFMTVAGMELSIEGDGLRNVEHDARIRRLSSPGKGIGS